MGKYWRDEIADGFTKTGVRLRFLLSCMGGVFVMTPCVWNEYLNREFCHAVNISYCIQFIFHRNAGSSCSNGRQWRWRNYSRRADGPYHI
ncbi:hypothetical protein DP238_21720 [Escherichia coli]|nr:hypothetical protein [Escherichia coli]